MPMRNVLMLRAPGQIDGMVVDTGADNFAGEILDGQVTFVASVELPTSSIVLLANKTEQDAAATAELNASVLPPLVRRERAIFGRALAVRVDVRGEPLDLFLGEYLFEAVARGGDLPPAHK